jgi:hypothetical protein
VVVTLDDFICFTFSIAQKLGLDIKGSFDPSQVATIPRAMADIEVKAHPDRLQGKPDLQGPNAFR